MDLTADAQSLRVLPTEASEPPEPLSVLEKVLGPVNGYYLALYACPMGAFGRSFIGYYKVCREAVSGFHGAQALETGCVDGAPAPLADALGQAQEVAVTRARQLPPGPGADRAQPTELSSVLYVSMAVRRLADQEVTQILLAARGRNRALGLTGVLLHHNGQFMQYLEGPAPELEMVYDAIKADIRHTGLIELARLPLKSREFDDWAMGYASSSTAAYLAQPECAIVGARLRQDRCASACRHILSSFWNRALLPA